MHATGSAWYGCSMKDSQITSWVSLSSIKESVFLRYEVSSSVLTWKKDRTIQNTFLMIISYCWWRVFDEVGRMWGFLKDRFLILISVDLKLCFWICDHKLYFIWLLCKMEPICAQACCLLCLSFYVQNGALFVSFWLNVWFASNIPITHCVPVG